MTTPKTICMLPWISMEVTPMGTYRPCCLYGESIPGYSVRNNHSIADAQNSDYMKDLRQQFLDGKKPAGCNMCWQEESVPGRMSKRRATFIKVKQQLDYTEDSVAPIFLDLKLGNICNLKCRICGSWSSSKWAQEEIDIANGDNDLARQQLQHGQWPRKIPSWWEALEDALPHIEYLEFTGGEPFLILEHFALLEKLVERGYSKKIDIHYNTNGTVWPAQNELWKHFKRVEIAFSIDDIGRRFEYQRTGAKWHEVMSNLEKFRELRQTSTNIQLQLCCTISIWNVLYFNTIAHWAASFPWDFVYWNYLHDSPVWCVQNVVEHIKERIIGWLLRESIDHPYGEDRKHLIDFMLAEEGWIGVGGGGTLTYEISRLDTVRGQNLADYMPELARILDYKGPIDYR